MSALPAVVADLMRSLGRDDAGARLLADKIAQDQALTAKTLRLANSSFYGMQRNRGGDDDNLAPAVADAAWDRLKLDQAVILQLFRDAKAQTAEACRILMTTEGDRS